ncbi:uncharacterized protein M421DRAFT_54300, partial [Didymella exigua CBS 183.55]
DRVRNKGQGSIILLSGTLGAGKKSTAEAIGECYHRLIQAASRRPRHRSKVI